MDDTAKEIQGLRMDFNALSINLTNFMKTHEAQMEEFRIRQKDHHENIYGTSSTPGLRIEQDRQKLDLERMKVEEKSRKATLVTIGIGLVMLILATLWKMITGK